jgi:hypothetical protein
MALVLPAAWAAAGEPRAVTPVAPAAVTGEVAPIVDPRQPVNAVWVEHDLRFTYFGYTTYYSCDGLRNKLEYVLEHVGARKDDLKVHVLCMNGSGPEYMPSVRIHVAMPAEATPELLAKLAEGAPERELLARVRGRRDAADTATAQFPAVWRQVVFEGRRFKRIDPGDCELLEQLVEPVFKPIGVRVAPDSRLKCTPRQVRVGSVLLKLDTLQRQQDPDDSQKLEQTQQTQRSDGPAVPATPGMR